jgi:hypothetical protein
MKGVRREACGLRKVSACLHVSPACRKPVAALAQVVPHG